MRRIYSVNHIYFVYTADKKYRAFAPDHGELRYDSRPTFEEEHVISVDKLTKKVNLCGLSGTPCMGVYVNSECLVYGFWEGIEAASTGVKIEDVIVFTEQFQYKEEDETAYNFDRLQKQLPAAEFAQWCKDYGLTK